VAGDAQIGRLIVRKRSQQRHPHIGAMADFTKFGRCGMVLRFIRTIANAIMATATIASLARYQIVVKDDLQPIGGVMTHIAGLRGRNMSGTLTDSYGTVMTVLAQIRGLTVIEG